MGVQPFSILFGRSSPMKPMKFKPYSREKIEQFRFVKLPKALFEDEMFDDLSIYAKVLYGFMRDRLDLSVASGLFDKDTGNYFIYYTVEDVKKNLHCANSKACALLKELEDVGLILRTRQGQGKAAKIYVNNFAECDDEEIGDKEGEKGTPVETSKNQKSRIPENESLEFQKVEGIDTKKYIETNNTETYYSNNNDREELKDGAPEKKKNVVVKKKTVINSFLQKIDEKMLVLKEAYQNSEEDLARFDRASRELYKLLNQLPADLLKVVDGMDKGEATKFFSLAVDVFEPDEYALNNRKDPILNKTGYLVGYLRNLSMVL